MFEEPGPAIEDKLPKQQRLDHGRDHVSSPGPILPIETWKRQVAECFGKAAAQYEGGARLQTEVVNRLVARISKLELPAHPRILEIGCGTGLLTRALQRYFPAAEWVVTDLSPAMLESCRAQLGGQSNVTYICMDGESSALLGGFDLVCSSLALQWFVDLDVTLPALALHLRRGAHFAYATLVEGTFAEWIAAHEAAGLKAQTLDYRSAESLGVLWPPCGRGRIETETLRFWHRNGREFLAEIKQLGANTPARTQGRAPLGAFRRLLREIDKPKGVYITYEVAYGLFTRRAASTVPCVPCRGHNAWCTR